jgi:hypothetical protein
MLSALAATPAHVKGVLSDGPDEKYRILPSSQFRGTFSLNVGKLGDFHRWIQAEGKGLQAWEVRSRACKPENLSWTG